MDGITSIRMSAGGTDFISGRNLIRWTEVFLMPSKNPERPIQDNDDPARAAGHLARAICMALTPNLAKLKSDELSPLAVRVNLDPDNVSFKQCGKTRNSLPRKFFSVKSIYSKVL